MKCALYSRVSTEEQARGEYSSIEAQFDKLESYAFSQDAEIIEKYADRGLSAANMNRPALQKMLSDASTGKFDTILFYKVDRLTRCTYDFYKISEEVAKDNIALVAITQDFNTKTPAGRVMLTILLGFAQFERELTGERTRDKMYERAKRGMWNGGFTPIGYKCANKKIIIDHDEELIVKHIYDRFLQTKSLAAVKQSLKSNGFLMRNGQPISKGTIEHVLGSPVYAGKTKFKDEVFEGQHEAIIDQKTWETVQAFRGEKSRSHPRVKVNRVFLLKGLLRCQTCGSAMTPSYTKNRKKNGDSRYTYYYRCTSTVRKSYDACPVKTVNADWIEKAVLQVLLELTNNEEMLAKCIDEANNVQDSLAAPLQIEKGRLTKQLAKIEKEASRILLSFIKDETSEPSSFVKDRLRDLDHDKKTLSKELDVLNGRLSTANIKKLSLETIRRNFQTFHANFDNLDMEQKQNYVQLLVQQVIWDGEQLSMEIYELPEGLLDKSLKNRTTWLPG